MVFVMILVMVKSAETCAVFAAGVICFFVLYLRLVGKKDGFEKKYEDFQNP